MKIYNYDIKTKEFLNEELAELDPIDNKPLIPAYSTTKEPLTKKEGFAICFDENNGKWEYKKDLRGMKFWSKTDGSMVVVDSLDFDKTNYTSKEPKENQIMKEGKWVDDIESFQKIKIKEIEEALFKAEFSELEYKGDVFWGRQKDRELLTQTISLIAIVLGGAVPDDFIWRSKNNVNHKFSLEDYKGLALAFANRTKDLAIKSWTLKEKIKNAKSIKELEEIKW